MEKTVVKIHETYLLGIVGTPLPIKGGGLNLIKIDSLRGVPKNLLERGDNPEKEGG